MEQVKVKRPNWRPSKRDDSFIEKAYEYIDQCIDEPFKLVKSESTSNSWESTSWENKLRVKLPSIEWFGLYIGVVVSTLLIRAKENESFSKALEDIKQAQREKLIANGASGIYNPTITKLLLSHNHGIKETTVQEHTGKDWWAIQIDYSKLTNEQLQEEMNKLLSPWK